MPEQPVEILLVEDNPAHAELILIALRKQHLAERTRVARDGAEALEFLFGSPESNGHSSRPLPRLILLDLRLPRVNGLEVLARVKTDARTKSIPVVCMTSSSDEKDVRESYRLGANSYILKSVDFIEMARKISSVTEYWLELNRPPA